MSRRKIGVDYHRAGSNGQMFPQSNPQFEIPARTAPGHEHVAASNGAITTHLCTIIFAIADYS
jgi:hypothetical protein